MKVGLGTVASCCPEGTGFFSAVFSNSCSYCTSADRANEERLRQLPINDGNTGVPNCDPNDGFWSNLFSNQCNIKNVVGEAIGVPGIPTWAFLLGGGIIAAVALREFNR